MYIIVYITTRDDQTFQMKLKRVREIFEMKTEENNFEFEFKEVNVEKKIEGC